jgi:hypothetical protein
MNALTCARLCHEFAQRCLLRRRDAQLQDQELALHVLAARHVLDAHHVDELQQLARDLVDHRLGALRHERQARHQGIFGGRDVEGFDVEAAAREQSRYACERAGLVLQQDGDDVTHGTQTASWLPYDLLMRWAGADLPGRAPAAASSYVLVPGMCFLPQRTNACRRSPNSRPLSVRE